MSATAITRKQELEELITSLVNLCLKMKVVEHSYQPEKLFPEVTSFFDLPLCKIYNLVENSSIVDYTENDSQWVEKEVVIKLLQFRREEESGRLNSIHPYPDDVAGKTDIRKWAQEKYTEQKQMGARLFNILHINSRHLQYVEHIDKNSFCQCRNAGEKTWLEFVRLRGY